MLKNRWLRYFMHAGYVAKGTLYGLIGIFALDSAVKDTPSASASILRAVQRCGYGISGLTYLGIAYTAAKLSFGLTVKREDTIEEVASVLFERTLGAWLFIGVGVVVIGVGLSYLYGAYSGSYISELRPSLPKLACQLSKLIGKVGIAARGLGFIVIGLHLIRSAYRFEEEAAGGLGEVLSQLDKQPGGMLG